MPGHRYLLKGQAYKALMLTIAGGLFAGIGAICALPLFIFILPSVEWLLPKIVPVFLSAVIAITVMFSRHKKETAATVLLSAILCIIVLKRLSIQNGIMAIVIGLFSLSTLTLSLMRRPRIRKQDIGSQGVEAETSLKGSALAIVGSATISIMPGIGPSQAAFILRKVIGRLSSECYLVVLGGINACNIISSLFVMPWERLAQG